MKLSDIVIYILYAMIIFAVYFIGVPALISAKSTLAVVAGVFLILAGAAFVINYAIKAFTQKEETKNE